jgi:hypothetical protein
MQTFFCDFLQECARAKGPARSGWVQEFFLHEDEDSR